MSRMVKMHRLLVKSSKDILLRNYKWYFKLPMLATTMKLWKSLNVEFSEKNDDPMGSFMVPFANADIRSLKYHPLISINLCYKLYSKIGTLSDDPNYLKV